MKPRRSSGERKRGPKDPKFQKLQAKWDARLRAEGFVDIEGGRDLNRLSTSSLPGDRFVSTDAVDPVTGENFDNTQAFVDEAEGAFGSASLVYHPQAVAWRRFAAFVHALPNDCGDKPLLLDVAEEGCASEAILKKYGRTKAAWHHLLKKFCRAHNLPTTGLSIKGRVKKRAP